jgi:hypothetical protein
MRESWTDERMDDLSSRMDQGFEEMRGLHVEMNKRFDALQQTMFLAAAGVIASLVGLVATQL